MLFIFKSYTLPVNINRVHHRNMQIRTGSIQQELISIIIFSSQLLKKSQKLCHHVRSFSNMSARCQLCGGAQKGCLFYCSTYGVYLCNGKSGTELADVVRLLKYAPDAVICDVGGNPFKCCQCQSTRMHDLGWWDTRRGIWCTACFFNHCGDTSPEEATRLGLNWNPLISNNILSQPYAHVPSYNYDIPMEDLKQRVFNIIQKQPVKLERPKLETLGWDEQRAEIRIAKLKGFVQEEERASKLQHLMQNVKVTGAAEWSSPFAFSFVGSGRSRAKLLKEFKPGRRISVQGPGGNEIPGCVSHVEDGEIHISLNRPIKSQPKTVTIKRWFTDTPFARANIALAHWQSCPEEFLDILAGDLSGIDRKINWEGKKYVEFSRGPLSCLNTRQLEAIRFAMNREFAAIQGPPGCGKSTCIALHAINLAYTGLTVLICTRDNAAADRICEILLDQEQHESSNCKYCRVVGESYKECVSDYVLRICSHKAGNKKSDRGRRDERARIEQAHIIISTCCTAGGARMDDASIDVILFDEANTLSDPDLLIPLVKFQPSQVTLYGDQMQIGPFAKSTASQRMGYGISLIQRLAALGSNPKLSKHHRFVRWAPFMLQQQYRMHPQLAVFPSEVFYDKRLSNGVGERDRRLQIRGWKWPSQKIPLVFCNVNRSKEQRTSDGKSFVNLAEMAICGRILNILYNGGIAGERIGIITFYQGQELTLSDNLNWFTEADEDWLDDVHIGTVDGFEGKDIDIVIIVCVRANGVRSPKRVGFLADQRRFNVAITRAKYGMFVIGHAQTLVTDPMWKVYLDFCKRSGVYLDF